ncbi:hypothetical protein [Salinarimonas soli]|uniref:Uncharacterized protein n=1 Tax=Salinarimonas soli TaxID=1638099 RepID=A0A5B2V9T0_9HYPH|nr:hypothetical protein [Salinarimonas soli]KAA2235190.1 hypothetical protein F0L46_20815 [Salinarimonas soli]
MEKLNDYHSHSQECRRLAALASRSDEREALLAMAETWERLAEERGLMAEPADEGLRPDQLTTENDG